MSERVGIGIERPATPAEAANAGVATSEQSRSAGKSIFKCRSKLILPIVCIEVPAPTASQQPSTRAPATRVVSLPQFHVNPELRKVQELFEALPRFGTTTFAFRNFDRVISCPVNRELNQDQVKVLANNYAMVSPKY